MDEHKAPQRVIKKIKSRYVVNDDGCWIWQGATAAGYGRIAWKATSGMVYRSVHRVLYEATVGPIPDGYDLDHLCHDPDTCHPEVASECPHRACINPEHLSPATRRENLLRGGTVAAARRATTHCPRGHEYSPENTLTSRDGRRSCKECTYEKNRAYYWKNRERRSEYNRQWRAKRNQLEG